MRTWSHLTKYIPNPSAARCAMDEILSVAAPSSHNVDGRSDLDCRLRLLLVGEGDFSFSVSLCDRLGWPFVSTTMETERSLSDRHADAAENVAVLQKQGCRVLYGVDATRLHEHGFDNLFACIVFNFPHVGGKSNVKRNRELLRQFFRSASGVLQDDGRVLVTLCQGQGGTVYDGARQRLWHDSWQVTAAAAEAKLVLNQVVPFSSSDFPGYNPRGYRSQDKPFLLDDALTHAFVKSVANDIEELTSVEAHFGCSSNAFFNHVVSKCQVTQDGHPCRLVLKIMADALEVGTALACPADRTDTHVSQDGENDACQDWPHCSEQMLSGHCCSAGDHCSTGGHDGDDANHELLDCFIHRIERTLPSALLAIPDVAASGVLGRDGDRRAVGSIGLRSAAYIVRSAGDAKLERLLDLRFGRWRLYFADSRTFDRHLDSHVGNRVPATSTLGLPLCGSAAVILADDSDEGNGKVVVVGKACVRGAHLRVALDLTAAAACIFDVPDEAWLWSADKRLLASCSLRPQLDGRFAVASFVPWSLAAPSYCHDLSFWLPDSAESFSEIQLCRVAQNVGGRCFSALKLRDSYRDPANGRISHCYRLHFRSLDAALSYAQSYACYQRIRSLAATDLGLAVR